MIAASRDAIAIAQYRTWKRLPQLDRGRHVAALLERGAIAAVAIAPRTSASVGVVRTINAMAILVT